MIEDTLANIEAAIRKIEAADPGRKSELLRLLGELKQQMRLLDKTHAENAGSVAGFADAAAHEATRQTPEPDLLKLSLDGLARSVRGFESSHPQLVETVDEICRELSSLGI